MPAKLLFNGRVLIALVMFLIFATMVGISFDYPAQARFMPLVVGLPGLALTLFELIREIRNALRPSMGRESEGAAGLSEDLARLIGSSAADRAAPTAEVQEYDANEMPRREAIMIGYFTGIIVGLIFLGFWITVPVFIVVFLREREKASWLACLGSAAIVLAILYFVFYRGLSIELHTGFLTDMVWEKLFAPE